MALDRQSIERKDFPVARRGYDQAAVDAHLSALADQVAELQAAVSQTPAPNPLATSAGDQVHSIIAAAETSAAEIRSKADTEARETLDLAHRQAGELSRSSAGLLDRLEESKRELETLIASLRGPTASLDSDLRSASAQRHLHAVQAETPDATAEPPELAEPASAQYVPAERARSEPAGSEAPSATSEAPPTPVSPAAAAAEPVAIPAPATPAPAPTAPVTPATGGPDETEGARLVALNMALDGTPREQTAQYLSEHFRLADREGLLDEVYSSVEG